MRKVRDSNPRYDVMRTPHFECGSFDHSDNFPTFVSRSSAVPLFTENASKRKRVQRYGFFFKHPNVLHIFCEFSAFLGAIRFNNIVFYCKITFSSWKFWLYAKKAVFLRPQAVKTACIVLKMASFARLGRRFDLGTCELRNFITFSQDEATKDAY